MEETYAIYNGKYISNLIKKEKKMAFETEYGANFVNTQFFPT